MNCFIKDAKTFRTKVVLPLLGYDIFTQSVYNESSALVLDAKRAKDALEGDIVFVENGYMGEIGEVRTEDQRAELCCRHISEIFARPIVFDGRAVLCPERFIKECIDAHYKNQPDEVYARPYIETFARTETPLALAPEVVDGFFDITAYAARARRLLDIFMDFTLFGNTLGISITKRQRAAKNLDTSDPSVVVLEDAVSKDVIGKITTRAEDTGAAADWYLLADGSVTRTAIEGMRRKEGRWEAMSVKNAADMEVCAKEAFAKNTYAHKLLIGIKETGGTPRFSFGEKLLISHGGRLFESYVASVREKSGNTHTTYQCGELRTLYTDKLKEEL